MAAESGARSLRRDSMTLGSKYWQDPSSLGLVMPARSISTTSKESAGKGIVRRETERERERERVREREREREGGRRRRSMRCDSYQRL